MYYIISTCNRDESANSGDKLLEVSAKKLLKISKGDGVEFKILYREESLDPYIDDINNNAKAIILPGFAIRKNTYPDIYHLAHKLSDIKRPIIPLGMGSKSNPGDEESVRSFEMDENTIKLLDFIEKQDLQFSCRDVITEQVLKRYGYKTTLTGDCGMFDPDILDKNVSASAEIKKIVFTTPHAPRLSDQAHSLLLMVKRAFPNADIAVSFQSAIGHGTHEHEFSLIDVAKSNGLRILNFVGDAEGMLSAYRDYDFHIGYRCHGHISFLRLGKPSLLIAEDGRGAGFNATLGSPSHLAYSRAYTEIGSPLFECMRRRLGLTFRALFGQFYLNPYIVNPHLVGVVESYLDSETSLEFMRLKAQLNVINHLYHHKMMPFIENYIP